MKIIHKPRGTVIPKEAQRVFLCYDGCDTAGRDAIISDLFSVESEVDFIVPYLENYADIDENELSYEISEAQALVIWVTPEMLEAAMSGKLPLEYDVAQKEKTPIIPILRYNSIFDDFNNTFGKIHCITKPYDDKFEDEQNKEYKTNLKAQIEKYLTSEEMVKLINEKAFTGSIFVGYRKHEREEAIRFMKTFHDLEGCVSISIRYDNFLTAGKEFNKEIEEIIRDDKTLALALAVTPDLATEGNYVQSTEYPLAQKIRKPVIPVEMKETSHSQFDEYFPNADKPIRLEDTVSLQVAIHGKLNKTAFVKELDNERAYLLGIAYLKRINVEKDFDRALHLLSFATEGNTVTSIKAANQLASIYMNGIEISINYDKALYWYKKTLAICKNVLGKEHADTATTYNNIALVYDSQGYYPKALEWYQKASTTFENVLGSEHTDTAITYNNIAYIYNSQGDYSDALEWYQKALDIDKKKLGEEHINTAITYNNIATVYYNCGDYSMALEQYQRVLSIREKVLAREHPDIAAIYNNIASIYYRQGDYLKALEWYLKALAIREKALGKEHPDTAVTCNNIAGIFDNQGDYPKALEWHQKALDIREKILGKDHPDTAATYNNIARVHDSQGNYPKALEWYQKALVIREKVLGKEHLDTATTYNNVAIVYDNQKDYLKALKWHLKALAIFEKKLGTKHPETATIYNNIAGVYDNQEDYPKALEWYRKALVIFEKKLGNEHPDTAIVYNNIAFIYKNQGNYLAALEWYQKALDIFEEKFGDEHPYVINIYNSTTAIYKKLKTGGFL